MEPAGTEFPFTQSLRVAFRDIDALGHVNNAVYLSYFEDARIRYLLELRGDQRVDQLSVILAESTVRYLQPVFYSNELIIGVRVASIGTKSLVMDYALLRGPERTLVTDGRTVLVWYDYGAGQAVAVPEAFRHAVAVRQGQLPPARPDPFNPR